MSAAMVEVPTQGVFLCKNQDTDFQVFVNRLLEEEGFANAGYAADFSSIFVHFNEGVTQPAANAIVQSAVDAHTVDSLAALKAERMQEVNTVREEWMMSWFSHDGHRWDCDQINKDNIMDVNTTALLLAQLGSALPADFAFRDRDNQNVPADALYMAQLAVSMATFRLNCYRASWIHKYMISVQPTEQAVNTYGILAGWPDRG